MSVYYYCTLSFISLIALSNCSSSLPLISERVTHACLSSLLQEFSSLHFLQINMWYRFKSHLQLIAFPYLMFQHTRNLTCCSVWFKCKHVPSQLLGNAFSIFCWLLSTNCEPHVRLDQLLHIVLFRNNSY